MFPPRPAVGARDDQAGAAATAHAVLAEVRCERLKQVNTAVPAVATLAPALQVREQLAVDILPGDEQLGILAEHVVPLQCEQLLRAQPGVGEYGDDERVLRPKAPRRDVAARRIVSTTAGATGSSCPSAAPTVWRRGRWGWPQCALR